MKKQKQHGITLVTLAITIIVIIILAIIAISLSTGTVDKAGLAKFTSSMGDIQEELQLLERNMELDYIVKGTNTSKALRYYMIARGEEFDPDEINFAELSDGDNGDTTGVYRMETVLSGEEILPEDLLYSNYCFKVTNEKIGQIKIKDSYFSPQAIEDHFITDKGEFFIRPGYRYVEDGEERWYVNEQKYYVGEGVQGTGGSGGSGNGGTSQGGNENNNQGNQNNEPEIVHGESSEYEKVGSIYVNSPDLSGFNALCTYYVTYDANGKNPSSTIHIDEDAPDGWYDYSTKRWANIVTENNGNVTYWVWIPRFMYKVTGTGTTDVRFVTTGNEYYEDINDTKTLVPLSGDYKLSDAFEFGEEGNKVHLSGYWISKYKIQLGGNDGTTYLGTTANIQIDLSGFNADCTYYVTYDANGKNPTEYGKISGSAPDDWYDYGAKRWANIVTKNNGNITYWTYIPRYEYRTYPGLTDVDVKFIPVTQTTPDDGFKIPDSFTFNGVQLKGYWISKYKIQE